MERKLSRRRFLAGLGTAAAGAALAACQPKTVIVKETVEVEVEKVVTQEIEKVVKETVIVEGTPKVVEKVVKETVVVEVAAKSPEELIQQTGDKLGSPDHPRGWKTILPDLPRGYPLPETQTIQVCRRVTGMTFAEGDTIHDNPYSRMIKALFNIEFDVMWTWTAGDEGTQKYNLAMASGDMPDFLEDLPADLYVKAVEADLLEDITDAWSEYVSPRWQASFRDFGDLPWVIHEIDGRRYAFPKVAGLAQNDCVLWYREDWLEKLGLDVPDNFEELHDVALEFVKNDIGIGAAGSTIGLVANATYSNTWYGSLAPLWGGFGAIPSNWSQVGDGIVLDATRPECKEGLEMLRQWYEDGIFRRDFYTFTASSCSQDVHAGQAGLHFTPSWGASRDSMVNDPEARWNFAKKLPAGPTGLRTQHTHSAFKPHCHCFRKGSQQVENVFNIANWMIELTEDFERRYHGWEGYNYTLDDGKYNPTGLFWFHIGIAPIGTRGGGRSDPRKDAREIRYCLEEWGKIPPEERDAYQEFYFEDPTGIAMLGAESRLWLVEHTNEALLSEFQGLPTPTMVERGADLQKVIDETYIGIIIGEKPMSDFDAMVEQWTAMGGDKVTEEVNAWWQEHQG